MSVVACIQGDTGTTKTTLALTFPKPIFHMELDIGGFARAARRFKAEIDAKQIVSKKYFLPMQVVEDQLGLTQASRIVGVRELWYEFQTDYARGLKDYATVIVDSFTQLWEMCHLGFLQEKQERQKESERLRESLLEIEYGEPNTRMRSIIYQARRMDKNLVLVSPLTDVSQDVFRDGKVQRVVVGTRAAGWRHAPKELDFIIEMRTENEGTKDEPKTVPYCKIIKSAVGLELVGLNLRQPTWSDLEMFINMGSE